ncbi:excisionase family DNA binding protein [Saccharothrix coeruleofusca]|uniref:helix-turn-helix transcriptional regulator n=1 Tax=Saccharothrix coeruleofusca TaxID=33919 RepID=UPI001AE9528D|nr:helix-turn-helix domain-containing protein [Saccharothrix coeruleofusca]MBP2339049.1 excisionase family DNA binding protein [Saccharothrix coeruleofusca]
MTKLWSVQELADYLGVPVATIYKWRTQKYGPPGRRVGKYVRYRPADVEAWITALPSEAA